MHFRSDHSEFVGAKFEQIEQIEHWKRPVFAEYESWSWTANINSNCHDSILKCGLHTNRNNSKDVITISLLALSMD